MADEQTKDTAWGAYALKISGAVIALLLSLLVATVKWQANSLYSNVLNHDERLRKLEIDEAVCCPAHR